MRDAGKRAANLVAHLDGLLFDQLAEAGLVRSRAELRDAILPVFTAAFAGVAAEPATPRGERSEP